MIQETSYMAFIELKKGGRIGQLQEKVFEYFYIYPNSTDFEISRISGLPINIITARRNELAAMGVICESGRKRNLTGRDAIKWVCINNTTKQDGLSHNRFQLILKNIRQANQFQRLKIKEFIEEKW